MKNKILTTIIISGLLLSGCQPSEELKNSLEETVKTVVIDKVSDVVEDLVTNAAGNTLGNAVEELIESKEIKFFLVIITPLYQKNSPLK